MLGLPSWLSRVKSHMGWQRAVAVGSVLLAFGIISVCAIAVGDRIIVHGPYWSPGVWKNWWLDGLFRWDAGWYRDIAVYGYWKEQATAFFPLFPLLLHFASLMPGLPIVAAGAGISIVSLAVALWTIHALITERYSQKVATRTLWLLALFPGSMFFASSYSDALFLALIALFFYFLDKNQWVLVFIIGLLAALTRNTGILLEAPILWDLVSRVYRRQPVNWLRSLAAASGGLFGLGSYMVFLSARWGNPLAFMVAERAGWAMHLVMPFLPNVVVISAMLQHHLTPNQTLVYLETDVAIAVAFGVSLYMLSRSVFTSGALFSLLSVLVTVTAAQMYDLPSPSVRYVAVLFPVFVGLSSLTEDERWYSLLLSVFVCGFVANLTLFSGGYWMV